MLPATITFVTIHVCPSDQAISLATATITAAISETYQQRVTLIDGYLNESDSELLNKIVATFSGEPDPAPNCVGFSMYVWNKLRVLTLAQNLRQLYPQTILIVGGPEATACNQQLCSLNLFDLVVAGEGEGTINTLLGSIADHTQNTSLSNKLTAEIVDMEQQISPWLRGILQPQQGVLWEISRGCPFNCSFCYDARGTNGVRAIPAARIEQELKLFARCQVSQIWVLDSTFNFPAERGKKLLRQIIQYAPHIHFHFEAKAEYLDEETVDLLQQINCSVQVGLQSAQPQVLRHINRVLKIEQFSTKVQMLSSAGVTFGIDLIYGLPGDNLEGFRQSIDFALQFGPNQVEMFPLALLPGTKLAADRELFGLQALQQPPYTITSTDNMTTNQLLRCQMLANASAIFYNTGRAVAYFLPLCRACNISAIEFIEFFTDWMDKKYSAATDNNWWQREWSITEVYNLQRQFVAQLFEKHRALNLVAIALDIIHWHYCWSNTLIGAETPPANIEMVTQISTVDPLQQHWQLAPSVLIQEFAYPVDELSMIDEIDLVELGETIQPRRSIGLFIRRADKVFCESIDKIFSTLLLQCNSTRTPTQVLAQFTDEINLEEKNELTTFAITEGLLIPADT
ncbi:MAG: hypothetical protein B6I36_03595 [Desulfobacteraceae bacterium 4572_35.1]|nr:MAG: hypothetical protein B6I36_03595 [Desulfobacteraceae bacterium 4572_35.1]